MPSKDLAKWMSFFIKVDLKQINIVSQERKCKYKLITETYHTIDVIAEQTMRVCCANVFRDILNYVCAYA